MFEKILDVFEKSLEKIKNIEEVKLVIDGDNLFGIQRQLKFKVDFIKFQELLERMIKEKTKKTPGIQKLFFVPTEKVYDEQNNPKPFFILLGYLEYKIIHRLSKIHNGKRQSTMDSLIMTEIIRTAIFDKHCKLIILVSGDQDFADAIELAKEINSKLKVWVIASKINMAQRLRELDLERIIYIDDHIEEIRLKKGPPVSSEEKLLKKLKQERKITLSHF